MGPLEYNKQRLAKAEAWLESAKAKDDKEDIVRAEEKVAYIKRKLSYHSGKVAGVKEEVAKNA